MRQRKCFNSIQRITTLRICCLLNVVLLLYLMTGRFLLLVSCICCVIVFFHYLLNNPQKPSKKRQNFLVRFHYLQTVGVSFKYRLVGVPGSPGQQLSPFGPESVVIIFSGITSKISHIIVPRVGVKSNYRTLAQQLVSQVTSHCQININCMLYITIFKKRKKINQNCYLILHTPDRTLYAMNQKEGGFELYFSTVFQVNAKL